MITRLGWATAAHGGTQGVRLATNLVLTRLLVPEIFGIMLIVNTLRTGAELLTDIGIGQNIVASKNGDDRDFLDTAWTLQVIRGVLVGGLIAAVSAPVAAIYGNQILSQILPLTGILVAILGTESVARCVALRHSQLSRLTFFEIAMVSVGAVLQIGFAWAFPTVWGLIYANLAGAAVIVVASYFILPYRHPRIHFNRVHAHEILHFGKWIFLSSIIYFISTNFDRLYLGTAIPFALLGIFGVARSLSEVLATFVLRIGNMIVFPAVAAAQGNLDELRRKLGSARLPLLLLAAVAIAGFVAMSDRLITIMYDARYHDAAYMLPVLAVGVWFTILATIAESVLLGVGRPVYAAVGNVAKLIWLAVSLPVALSTHGVMGGVIAIALADGFRYAAIWLAQKREGLSFARQDIGVTLLMVAMIALWREVFFLIGLTSTWVQWWTGAQALLK